PDTRPILPTGLGGIAVAPETLRQRICIRKQKPPASIERRRLMAVAGAAALFALKWHLGQPAVDLGRIVEQRLELGPRFRLRLARRLDDTLLAAEAGRELEPDAVRVEQIGRPEGMAEAERPDHVDAAGSDVGDEVVEVLFGDVEGDVLHAADMIPVRSEERRVGKGGGGRGWRD